jgi:hypothetical protein
LEGEEMTEKPILFSTEMVKVILVGRKSMTRRVCRWQRELSNIYDFPLCDCPYGKIGGKLWVRETHYRYGFWATTGVLKSGKSEWTFQPVNRVVFYTDNLPKEYVIQSGFETLVGWYKRPSIFMPRWASRINLEVTDIRVQRIQEISADDVENEGLKRVKVFEDGDTWMYKLKDGSYQGNAKLAFQSLWDSINEKRGYGWDTNCWVWAISFKVEQP